MDIILLLLLPWTICIDLYHMDRSEDLNKYLNIFDSWVELHKESTWYQYYKATISYLKQDYEDAYSRAKNFYNQPPLGKWFFSETAVICLIKMGRIDEAQDWKNKLIENKSVFPGQLEYALGIIEGHLGNSDQAINHFKQATKEGFLYIYFTYRDDMLTKEFRQIPEFMSLTEPR